MGAGMVVGEHARQSQGACRTREMPEHFPSAR